MRRCEAFLTNDARLKRVTEIRVLTLDDLPRRPKSVQADRPSRKRGVSALAI